MLWVHGKLILKRAMPLSVLVGHEVYGVNLQDLVRQCHQEFRLQRSSPPARNVGRRLPGTPAHEVERGAQCQLAAAACHGAEVLLVVPGDGQGLWIYGSRFRKCRHWCCWHRCCWSWRGGKRSVPHSLTTSMRTIGCAYLALTRSRASFLNFVLTDLTLTASRTGF